MDQTAHTVLCSRCGRCSGRRSGRRSGRQRSHHYKVLASLSIHDAVPSTGMVVDGLVCSVNFRGMPCNSPFHYAGYDLMVFQLNEDTTRII